MYKIGKYMQLPIVKSTKCVRYVIVTVPSYKYAWNMSVMHLQS